ncbi:MAG: tail fiber domain-containing protein, partial [Dysgonamonadaceae bacterium]|nr:tail fiber domain-containing protein [Dysgonamonadaceae bacterium]
MKNFISVVLFFAFAANVSAQLQVDETGDTHVIKNLYLGGSLISGTSTVPITLKVNGVLAGSTGASGKYNVSFGYRALYSNTTGIYNTASGNYALTNNTTGNYNIAIGSNALHFNTTGDHNTANGSWTLYRNTTGSYNTATGSYALQLNTTGNSNTAIGGSALSANTTGSYNICIGDDADVNATNLNYATAIGCYATATSSNQVRIGYSTVTSIGGYAGWTNLSDGRAKKNIRTDVPGLAFINRLQPVTYHLDLDVIDGLLKIDRKKRPGEDELPQELIDIEKKGREAKEKQVQTGFVAQDVEKVAQSIGYDFSGVDVDETGIYGLRYAEFVVPLVKAVQELSEQNDRLQAQNDQMQAQNDQMQKQMQIQNDRINELTELVSGLLGDGTESGALR